MELESQVTSLEPSKLLEKLGVKQESLCWWARAELSNWYLFDNKEGARSKSAYSNQIFSAFTVAELGEMLKKWACGQGNSTLTYPNMAGTQWCSYALGNYISADTEADARAKMLIYLLENGLITLKDIT